MTEPQKNSRLSHVPSILAGTAALLAAVSTLYVNLRGDKPEVAATVAPATPATPATTNAPATPVQPQALRLRLDRVQVDDDGSMGSTDWTFQVSLDGAPAFSVSMPALSDKPGENVVQPAEGEDASARLVVPAGRNVALAVTGWKKGWLGGARGEVDGSGWLASGFDKTSVTLQGDKPKGPRFVLYFTASPME